MKALKWIIGGAVGLIVLLAAIGLLLPREVTVERQTIINAPATTIAPAIANLSTFAEWSPWAKYDPDMINTFSGPEEGVGASMEWASDVDNVGSGTMKVTGQTDERIDIALDFGAMGLSQSYWLLDEADGSTQVTWGFHTDMGAGPMGRWVGLLMDEWIGPEYENGLANLKAFIEG